MEIKPRQRKINSTWMDGGQDGWMDRWMDGWMDGCQVQQCPQKSTIPRITFRNSTWADSGTMKISLYYVCISSELALDLWNSFFCAHHHHWPPFLGSCDLNRVDGGEENAVADANEEAADIDKRQAGRAGDTDPGHQDWGASQKSGSKGTKFGLQWM